jgi:hypothetical protein
VKDRAPDDPAPYQDVIRGLITDHAWRVARRCKCSAEIPYKAHWRTKWCTGCKASKYSRRYAEQRSANVRENGHLRSWTRKEGRTDLCAHCGNKREIGKTVCQPCADKRNAAKRARRIESISNGFCAKCYVGPLSTLTLCTQCNEKELKRKRDKLAKER